MLASCSPNNPPKIAVQTEIVHTHIPAALAIRCPTEYTGPRVTAGDLLKGYQVKSRMLTTCAARVDAIINWDAQPALPTK